MKRQLSTATLFTIDIAANIPGANYAASQTDRRHRGNDDHLLKAAGTTATKKHKSPC